MRTTYLTSILAVAISVLHMTPAAFGDGTNTLGAPTVGIAPGTGAVYAGVGLLDAQPAAIEVSVPTNVTVEQVLLYWAGRDLNASPVRTGDDIVTVDGINVEGTLIGGPITTGSAGYRSYAFRADITDLGLVAPGQNSISVGGLSFTSIRYGAGVVVITDDGEGVLPVELLDGLDFAWRNGSVIETVPQTFYLGPSNTERAMVFQLMVADVTPPRPNALHITAGSLDELLVNPFFSSDGNWWDTVTVPVVIPADAESVTIQPLSYDDGSGNAPSSLFWINVSLSRLDTLELYGCSPGFWKNHLYLWPEQFAPSDLIGDVFDVSVVPELGTMTLAEALGGGGGPGLYGAARILLRAATAAVLNEATYGANFPPYPSVAALIAAVNDVLALQDRALILDLADQLDQVNNLGCPDPGDKPKGSVGPASPGPPALPPAAGKGPANATAKASPGPPVLPPAVGKGPANATGKPSPGPAAAPAGGGGNARGRSRR